MSCQRPEEAALPQMFRSHGKDVMRRAMAVVNVVNQTSTLVPAVLGGVLYAAVLGRDSITFALDS